MAVGGGGYVLGDPGAGLQDGEEEDGVQAGGRVGGSLMKGELSGSREEDTECVSVGEVAYQVNKGGGGGEVLAGGVEGSGDGVEIANQEGWNGEGGYDWSKGVKKGGPLAAKIVAGGGMEVDEGERTNGDEVGVARQENGGGGGQRGKGDQGAVGGGTGEDCVAASGGKGLKRGRKAQLLEKNQVGAVAVKKGGEAGEVAPPIGVKGEDSEERGWLLPIVPMSRRHR